MGMITVKVAVENVLDPSKRVEFEALVDRGATYMTLPSAWRDRLGAFPKEKMIDIELADQSPHAGQLCAPAKVQIEGFEDVYTEVLFIDMQPSDGKFEPLLGCLPLETGRMAVDLEAHQLVSMKRAMLK